MKFCNFLFFADEFFSGLCQFTMWSGLRILRLIFFEINFFFFKYATFGI